jgi:hypothetical protein
MKMSQLCWYWLMKALFGICVYIVLGIERASSLPWANVCQIIVDVWHLDSSNAKPGVVPEFVANLKRLERIQIRSSSYASGLIASYKNV